MSDAPSLAQQASLLAQNGDDAAASSLYEQGLELFPHDARFANSAGNFHARAGRDTRALELFERALALEPELEEAAINAAIVLLKMDQPAGAAQLLAQHEAGSTRSARYWTI
ncbi:MAG TPA: tetratricopeptide repeat protein, partial [Erythrobacter sp.]|nr:tetratricopeptide repeat protein [Erythrobacter sp.]